MPNRADDASPTAEETPKRAQPFLGQGLVLACGIVLACWLCGLGLPVPRWDDGIYKSPGAELAQHGRLIVPAAKGFLPQADHVFAAYPPLYQLAIAGWYLLFGVSLRSSLAFSFTLHLLGVLGVMAVADRLVRAAMDRAGSGRCLPTVAPCEGMTSANATLRAYIPTIVVVGVGLIHLANLSHFDRPEEAALLWIWLEVLAVHGLATRPGLPRALASGLLLGLAALTAPWVGVLGVLIVTLRATFTAVQSQAAARPARWSAMIAHLAIAAVAAAAMTGTWYAVMQHSFPGAVREQMGATLGYLKGTQLSVGVWQKLAALRGTLFDNRFQLPAAVVALAFFAGAAARVRWLRALPTGLALYWSGATGIVVVGLVRPAAYTYFGATLIVLLPCLALAMARDLGRDSTWRLAMATLLVCAVAAWGQTGVLAVAGPCAPESQRPDRVFAQLRAAIPAGQSVAATSTHWLAFQGRNPWREVLFAACDPREAAGCQWLVLPSGVGQPDFIDHFEFVGPAPSLPTSTQGYGYSLWHHREGR
jgi:hypothetical protein